MNGRAQDSIQQDVSGVPVNRVRLRDALLELNVTVHAKLARRRGREAGEVRLNGARDQDRVGRNGLSLAQIELQLAHLVAAERQTRAVIALDIKAVAPEPGAQVGHRFEGGRRMA